MNFDSIKNPITNDDLDMLEAKLQLPAGFKERMIWEYDNDGHNPTDIIWLDKVEGMDLDIDSLKKWKSDAEAIDDFLWDIRSEVPEEIKEKSWKVQRKAYDIKSMFKIAIFTEDVSKVSREDRAKCMGDDVILAYSSSLGSKSSFTNVVTGERFVIDWTTGYGSVDDAATYYYYDWEKVKRK